MPSLAEIFLRWVNTVLMLINRRSAISLLVNPFANRQSTSISRCDSSLPSERLWRDVSIMSPSCFRNAASSQWRLSVKPILSSVELDSEGKPVALGDEKSWRGGEGVGVGNKQVGGNVGFCCHCRWSCPRSLHVEHIGKSLFQTYCHSRVVGDDSDIQICHSVTSLRVSRVERIDKRSEHAVADAVVLANVLFKTDDGEKHCVAEVAVVVATQMNHKHVYQVAQFVLD